MNYLSIQILLIRLPIAKKTVTHRVIKLNSIMHAGSKRSLDLKIGRKLHHLCPNLENEAESIPSQGR